MTAYEKIELLKDSIFKLYEKEGRSINYISDLLSVNRKILTDYIKNKWNFIKADIKHMTPSKEKFLNKNRKHIIDMLYNDNLTYNDISKELKISVDAFKRYLYNDKELNHYYILRKQRIEDAKNKKNEDMKDISSFIYDYKEYPDEIWKDILGYNGYQISNYGRVRNYAKKYKCYYILRENVNSKSGRVYVSIIDNEHKRNNLSIPRLVGFSFVDGYSEENNTINHIDMNVRNNKSENLEWISQSENNIKSYPYTKMGKFKKIVVDGKYEFKTIVSLAKFLNVSPTQAGRYLTKETKCSRDIIIVY